MSSTPLPHVAPLSVDDWRLLVESVQDYGIFMLDPAGHVATWNRGAEAIKGYSAEEIVGSHFSRFYLPEDITAGEPAKILAEARERGRIEREGWRVRKSGTRFWASVVVTALHDSQGVLRGFTKVTRDLSTRREAEEELRRSEERFRLLTEAVSDHAIYMLDPTGRVSTWNSGAQRIKGYDASEIIGRDFSTFFEPADVAAGKPRQELRVALENGHFEEEAFRLRKDGTRFWANVVVTPIRDSSGKLLGFAKVTRDLTARVLAEESARTLAVEQVARELAEQGEARLRESELRYRSLSARLEVIFDGIQDGIAVQDRSGLLIMANKAAAGAMGYPSVEALLLASAQAGASRYELLDDRGVRVQPRDLPGDRVLRGERSCALSVHVRDLASGGRWWWQVKATGVRGDDGETELAIIVWHDVTEVRRREQNEAYLAKASAALAQSLDYASTLSTLSGVLVPGLADWCAIHLLQDDKLELVSVAHADPERAQFARDVTTRFPPDPTQQHSVWQVLRTGLSELYVDLPDELLARTARGPEHLAILRAVGMRSALIVPIGTREHVFGTLTLVLSSEGRRYDAHDQTLAEEVGRRAGSSIVHAKLYAQAQAAAHSAQTANRMKDEFLATVSHELRTPLNAILGWASLLRKRSTDPSATKAVEIIHRNALSQGKIIEDILDVSRMITGQLRLDLEAVDLRSIVNDALDVVRPSASTKDITLRFVPPEHACVLAADTQRLQQVVWNLLSNAVKFSDVGGSVEVSIESARGQLVLIVRDTGRGIAPDFLPFVFDRFKQADGTTTRRVGGLGLGLAIVRHLVELHGGHATASSDGVGLGATFRVTLPVRGLEGSSPQVASSSSLPPRDDASTQTASGALRGARVLVVDDEQDARDLLAEVLREAGAEVATAASAEQGLGLLARFRPHVLVSDIGMPDEDGYAFVRRVRALPAAQGGQTPAIALTAYTRAADRARALEAGFDSHASKPVDIGALVTSLVELTTRTGS